MQWRVGVRQLRHEVRVTVHMPIHRQVLSMYPEITVMGKRVRQELQYIFMQTHRHQCLVLCVYGTCRQHTVVCTYGILSCAPVKNDACQKMVNLDTMYDKVQNVELFFLQGAIQYSYMY